MCVRTSEGQAFLSVMLILTALLVLGTAGVALASGLKRVTVMQEWRSKAYYAAEAGIERALLRLAGDPEWRDPAGLETAGPYLSSGGEPAGTIVRVRVADAAAQPGFGRRVQVTGTGSFREAEQQITATAVLVSNERLFSGISILPGVTGGRLDVPGELEISGAAGRGSLLVEGDLAVGAGGWITADVYISGWVVTGENRIQGPVEKRRAGLPRFPTVDEEWLAANATAVFHGNLTVGDPGTDGLDILTLEEDGIYFAAGTISITGTYHARATLVAGENIEITGDLRARAGEEDPGLLTLVALGRGDAAGDVTVSSAETGVDALILAAGAFRVAGDVELRGGVVARELVVAAPAPFAVRIGCDPGLSAPSAPSRDMMRTRPRIESWVGG